MLDRRLIQHFDWVLLFLIAVIGAISVLNLYSATYAIRTASGSQIFMKQAYWFLMGFAVLLMMTFFDYHFLERLIYPVYVLCLSLLGLVLVVGKVYSGSQRWLSLGGLSFQPSELMKFVMVIALAKYFSRHEEEKQVYGLRELWRPFVLIVLPTILIIKQPDLGTGLIVFIVSFSMILFARIRWKSLMILTAVFFLAVPFMWSTLKEYQQKRILTFIEPGLDPLGAGYHINQSKIAIGSGLFWGKGYLKGTQTRLHFLPEQHTDFAFSVLAEEWGFIGSLLVLLLYLFLVLWGINIANNSRDKFGTLIALGIVAIIFWHMVINVSMTSGLLPVVGIPLILLSYGGTSIMTTMAGLGLLMNISMRRFMFQ